MDFGFSKIMTVAALGIGYALGLLTGHFRWYKKSDLEEDSDIVIADPSCQAVYKPVLENRKPATLSDTPSTVLLYYPDRRTQRVEALDVTHHWKPNQLRLIARKSSVIPKSMSILALLIPSASNEEAKPYLNVDKLSTSTSVPETQPSLKSQEVKQQEVKQQEHTPVQHQPVEKQPVELLSKEILEEAERKLQQKEATPPRTPIPHTDTQILPVIPEIDSTAEKVLPVQQMPEEIQTAVQFVETRSDPPSNSEETILVESAPFVEQHPVIEHTTGSNDSVVVLIAKMKDDQSALEPEATSGSV